jgi:uridine phosphorylase
MHIEEFPILEYDPSPEAIIEPKRVIKPMDVPEHCVPCFFREVLGELVDSGRAKVIYTLQSEAGPNRVYELEFNGRRLAAFHPGVGAPLAVASLEEVIALGCRKFVACGGCGVLDKCIAVGHLLVPTAAVRDEGASYHYLPAGREVEANPKGVAAIESVLMRHNVEYLLTKTWTTDGIYRETAAKAALRRSEGCLTVEMEAAAFFAVACFRGVDFAQILYGGDAVIQEGWDSRRWLSRSETRKALFWLAAEAVFEL